MHWQIERRRFLRWLSLVWLGYATLQILYITRMPMVMDEFEGAHSVHQFASGLPYRDFDPYKTVLGYYFQLPALEMPHDLWRGMLAVKLEMAAAVILVFLGTTIALHRRLASVPLLLSTAMLVAMSNFAERSSDLRVDMLTALAGFIALVALIGRRTLSAGAMVAVSILISQKGVLYLAASGAVLVVDLIVTEDRRAALRRGLTFAGSFALVFLSYLTVWSLIATPRIVMGAVFGTAARVALSEVYSIRGQFWAQTLMRNPLYWLLAAIAIPILLRRWRDPALRSIAVYGAVILILGAWYRQPWPYFFVILSPTIFLLHAALLQQLERQALRRIAVSLCLILGVVYPLTRLRTTLLRDSAEQRWTVEFARAILAPSDRYLAGIDMVWDREQEPRELRWLDGTVAQQLRAKSPAELMAMAAKIRRAPIKLVIGSYRTASLPLPLTLLLHTDFEQLWGNIEVYSPRLRSGPFALKFSGSYRVEAASARPPVIDGHAVTPGSMLLLASGMHTLSSQAPIRLQLIPPGWLAFADSRFARRSNLYQDVYTY